ncbi:ATP-binding protein [Belnapia moabensis]|uniref:ATP-binding protein n=1 Tax=Belnapia moabensis TaxID=365533 RepID=UPI001470392E|nr:ATP-binding protein [Belnapia moabensis]
MPRLARLPGPKRGLRVLRGQVGTEQEMSFNRLIFALAFVIYFATAGQAIAADARPALLWWIAFSLAIFGHIRWRPALSTPRRSVALLLDMGFLTWFLHIGGALAAPFFPIYVWVMLGNGARFGVPWLAAAMATFALGFGWVIATTPFWQDLPHLSVGLLIAPAILGIYAMTLIRKLSQARQLAEQANEAKGQFLTSVSHELRTPLNAIIGMGGLLRHTRLDPEQQDMVRTVDAAAKSLLSLINGILDFARIEAGSTVVRPEAFDPATLLREVRMLLLAQAREKGLQLTIHITARTPNCLVADRRHLRDILLNLAGNAVKFTEAGGVVMALDASPAGPQRWLLRGEVSDTGIGIAAEARSRIFQRFTQADATIINRFGGTGLGLAICEGLVRLLGGEIGVESQPGQGSVFWFTAPLPAPDSGPTQAAAPAGISLLLATPAPEAATPLSTALQNLGLSVVVWRRSVDDLAELSGLPRHQAPLQCLLVQRHHPALPPPGPPSTPDRIAAAGDGVVVALCDEAPEGLPDLVVRQRTLSLLSGTPAAETLHRVLHHALAQLPGLEEGVFEGRAMAEAAPSGRRILVADDNRVNRAVTRKILEREGHQVVLVTDGDAALDALEAGPFDLVLMDLNMPELDGITATKLYRVAALGRPHLPIIGLTADASPEAQQRSREAGMDACLIKPIEPAALAATVATYLRPAAAPRPARPDSLPATPDPPSLPVDPQVTDTLERLGGQEFATELMTQFLEDATLELDRLRAAAARADVPQFRASAHALRSGAANMGALGVLALCKAAEAMPAAEIPVGGPRQAALLAVELARLRQARPGGERPLPGPGSGAPPA